MTSRSARHRRAERRAHMDVTVEERDALIRQHHKEGRSLTWIGETYGVNHYTVRRIVGKPTLAPARVKPRALVCPSCGVFVAVLEKQTGWCPMCVRVFRPELAS